MNRTQEIKNVKYRPQKTRAQLFWENLQLLVLALTILGQMTVGIWFLVGQGVWLVANLIATTRDFILRRPFADKLKNIVLTTITLSLILLNVFGGLF